MKRRIGVIIALALVGASCGGDDATAPETTVAAPTSTVTDTTTTEPPTTEAATTDAPTTEAPSTTTVTATEQLVLWEGFVTMDVPDGWVATPLDIPPPAYNFPDNEWEPRPPAEIVEWEGPTLQGMLGHEAYFHAAPDYPQWLTAVRPRFVESVNVNIDQPFAWAGGDGHRTIGTTADGEPIRLYTAGVGPQRLFAAVVGTADTSDDEWATAETMLLGIQVDPTALPPLAHSFDARRNVSAAVTGGVEFTVSVLVPANWTFTDSDAEGLFESPFDDGFVSLLVARADLDLDGEVARNLDEFADEKFFLGVPTVREDTVVSGVPTVIMWEGDPATTDAAILYGSDGVMFSTVLIYTPGDHDLLLAIIDSLVYPESALSG